ncbi:MAG: RNA 2',3'-cyclic phosphodiesterase [Thermoanaerobaculia bacterium]
MRLFLAIEIPGEVQRLLADGHASLRAELPKARWVRSELMHLTLVFLGDTDPDLVETLARELTAAVADHAPMQLTVTQAGAFPPRGHARVLWAGLEADGDLEGLQTAVAGAAERTLGELTDGKQKQRFHAHVTLARCRPPWPRWAVEKLVAALARDRPPDPFPVTEVALIESALRPEGPRYRTVGAYPLGGAG